VNSVNIFYKHSSKSCIKYCLEVHNTQMETLRMYEVTWDSPNTERIGLMINASAIPDKKIMLNRFITL